MQSQEQPATRNQPLECPKCFSHRAEIFGTHPLQARCFDCAIMYPIRTVNVETSDNQEDCTEQKNTNKKRKTKADYRAEITPAPLPKIPFNTTIVEEAIASGPTGVRQSQRLALRHARKFMVDLEQQWTLDTPLLGSLRDSCDQRNRARARYARSWRGRFLAILSMTNNVRLSCRQARISRAEVYRERAEDADFAKQMDEAVETAVDLLQARCWQRALEGDLEPVVYMGVVTGYVRKFSDKLQIEMLRAYKPDRFKTAGVNVNVGVKSDIFVLTEEQRHELQRINREWLLTAPIKSDPPSLRHGGTEQRDALAQNEPQPHSGNLPPLNAKDLGSLPNGY